MELSESKEETEDRDKRRVYVLPNDLLQRIIMFQKSKQIPSEVEAVRRLLDEALMRRDGYQDIIARFLSKMENTQILSDVVRDVLVGHPLVSSIIQGDTRIIFNMTSDHQVTIDSGKNVYVQDGDGNLIYEIDGELPF